MLTGSSEFEITASVVWRFVCSDAGYLMILWCTGEVLFGHYLNRLNFVLLCRTMYCDIVEVLTYFVDSRLGWCHLYWFCMKMKARQLSTSWHKRNKISCYFECLDFSLPVQGPTFVILKRLWCFLFQLLANQQYFMFSKYTLLKRKW